MVLTALGTALLVSMGAYLVLILWLSRRSAEARAEPCPAPLRWIFVIPALNEERVIANTIDSLLAVRGRTWVLVVDDGSDDATAEIVRRYPRDRVGLLQRHPPQARQGKGEALNAAYRAISSCAADTDTDPSQVIIGVVDGDGRLQADALEHLGRTFASPAVGAVQIQVRIHNRGAGWLARFQDYEFLTFSALTQSARQQLGSVGLGGNGQFTRLSALTALGDSPWTTCLTEDLDLGLRLAMAGWKLRFTTETEVSQQGLTDLRRIVRQRTRWMHGHVQCWTHAGGLVRSALPTVTVLDLLWYLAAPLLNLVVSLVFGLPAILVVGAAAWVVVSGSLSWPIVGWIVVLYAISFGLSLIFALVYWRRAGDISLTRALVMAHLLAAYNYVWYLATWKAFARALTRRRGWAKTERVAEEPLSGSPSAASA